MKPFGPKQVSLLGSKLGDFSWDLAAFMLLSFCHTGKQMSKYQVQLPCLVFFAYIVLLSCWKYWFLYCVCWQLWYWCWKCIIQTKRLIQLTENESPVGLQASLGPDVWREVVRLGLGPGLQPGRALQSLERARSNRRARFGLGLRQVFESSLYP